MSVSAIIIIYWLLPIYCNTLENIQCSSSEQQLFYANASDRSDWMFDNDGGEGAFGVYYYDSYCYVDDCFGIYVYDYGSSPEPNILLNNPVSTLGFKNINIIYFVNGQIRADGVAATGNVVLTCSASYTIDGDKFVLINENNFTGWSLPGSVNKASLSTETADINTLQLQFKGTNNVPDFNPNPGDRTDEHCYFDEIRLCGTAITDNPTNTPTQNPTNNPSQNPTNNPTQHPTNNPSQNPTNNPSQDPTTASDNPTISPTSSSDSRENSFDSLEIEKSMGLAEISHNDNNDNNKFINITMDATYGFMFIIFAMVLIACGLMCKFNRYFYFNN